MKKLLLIILLMLLMMASFWIMGQSAWHINRNEHNLLPAGKLTQLEGSMYQDEEGRNWELQPHIKNKFHQPDQKVKKPTNPYPIVQPELEFDPANPNLKFLSKTEDNGSYEAILQPDGTYLTEGIKQGTYNYGHPAGLWGSIKHTFLDVIPHFFNGNYSNP